MTFSRRESLACLASLATAPATASTGRGPDGVLVVFAATSLSEALDDIGNAYARAAGQRVRNVFAASSALARQLQHGARADVFISADLAWMDHVQRLGLIDPATRSSLAGNRLVLVAPSTSTAQVALARGADLGRLLGPRGRLAMGDPDFVPAGRYGRSALSALGLWDGVSTRLVRSESVRAALALVARGETPLGIVYASDAAAEPGVRVVATFPASSHPVIVYPMAATRAAATGAMAYLRHLAGPQAQAMLRRRGFLPPDTKRS